jgi:hypothetical protein
VIGLWFPWHLGHDAPRSASPSAPAFLQARKRHVVDLVLRGTRGRIRS